MTYNTDRTNLRKRGNTWWFRKTWTDIAGIRHAYEKSLQTHSLTVARDCQDEIMGRWDEVVAGDDFDYAPLDHRTAVLHKIWHKASEGSIQHIRILAELGCLDDDD